MRSATTFGALRAPLSLSVPRSTPPASGSRSSSCNGANVASTSSACATVPLASIGCRRGSMRHRRGRSRCPAASPRRAWRSGHGPAMAVHAGGRELRGIDLESSPPSLRVVPVLASCPRCAVPAGGEIAGIEAGQGRVAASSPGPATTRRSPRRIELAGGHRRRQRCALHVRGIAAAIEAQLRALAVALSARRCRSPSTHRACRRCRSPHRRRSAASCRRPSAGRAR